MAMQRPKKDNICSCDSSTSRSISSVSVGSNRAVYRPDSNPTPPEDIFVHEDNSKTGATSPRWSPRHGNSKRGGNKKERTTSRVVLILFFASFGVLFLFVSYFSSVLAKNGIIQGVDITITTTTSSMSSGRAGNTRDDYSTNQSNNKLEQLLQQKVEHQQVSIEQFQKQLQQQQQQLRAMSSYTLSQSQPVLESEEDEENGEEHSEEEAKPEKRKLGVLLGIFTSDSVNDRKYRIRQRKLIEIWDDPRLCSLGQFMKDYPSDKQYKCELIYTFVLGANPFGSTEIVNNSTDTPILLDSDKQLRTRDLNEEDVTRLNIKENMNEGKSQTFFYYASQVMDQYGLDYVIKCDADSAIHLHEFFVFAYTNLITYPDMNPIPNVYAGSLRDKAYWPQHETEAEQIRYESYFGNNYDGVHLYIAGQFYIISKNLVKDVLVPEVSNAHDRGYLEGHEDHDIAAILYHSHHPVHMITMGRQHRCWEHPVKGEKRWRRILDREQMRMNGKLFGKKLLSKDSSYEDVVIYRNSSLLPTYKATS